MLLAARQMQLRIATKATAAASALWSGVDAVDDTTATRWVDRIAPIAEASQTQSLLLASSTLQSYIDRASGDTTVLREPNVAELLAQVRNGVSIAEVYMRPVITARRYISEGFSLNEALRQGRIRALNTIDTDVMLAARVGAHDTMRRDKRVVGYRRVPGGSACKFCVLASTQRYHREQLMPLHPHCHCTVAPIVGTADPGQVLNRGLVDQLMTEDPALGKRGAARDAARAYHDEVVVHDHGELGPLLAQRGQHFTGPGVI